MKQILEKVNKIDDVLDNNHGVPNTEWVKTSIKELQEMIEKQCVKEYHCSEEDYFLPDTVDAVDDYLIKQ